MNSQINTIAYYIYNLHVRSKLLTLYEDYNENGTYMVLLDKIDFNDGNSDFMFNGIDDFISAEMLDE